MNQVYHHIATISCKHPYFKDGVFRSIGFSVSYESTKLLHDLGVIVKSFPGGIHLLSASPELLISEHNDHSFKFYLNSSDLYFINYTALPDEYSPSSDVFYFNNLRGSKLQHSAFVGEQDLYPLSNGTFNILDFDATHAYTFHDGANDEISQEYNLESFLDSSKYIIKGVPEGLIQVKLGNNVIQGMYYYPHTIWKKPLAIIELFTNALYQDYKKNEKANYEVNFNNRKTIWKYFLEGPKFEKFEDLSIVKNKKVKVFGAPEKHILPNNKEALVLTSDNEIPFQEYTEDNLLLANKYVSHTKYEPVINSLAIATPDQLFLEKNQDEHISYYSHIYIH